MQENLYEWIYSYFLMDEQAFKALVQYFRPITVAILYMLTPNLKDDYDRNKYLAYADQILYDCLILCRTDQYSKLKGFYRKVLKNRLIDLLKKEFNHSPQRFYSVVSLDELEGNMSSYYYYIDSQFKMSVHDQIMVKLESDDLMKEIQADLSADEWTIFLLKKNGFTSKDIADILQISIRKVSYTLSKIKKWYKQR